MSPIGDKGVHVHRDAHLEQFDRLTGLLIRMSRAVVAAVRAANAALLAEDVEAAAAVAARRATVRALRREVDALVPELLARRQPVASDLRLVLAAMRISDDLERMGVLAGHVARVAESRAPGPAVPPEARPLVAALAEAAATLTEKSALVLATRDPVDALQLALDDDVTDTLQRRLFPMLTGRWPHGVQAAVDVAMVGRWYERIADHAVRVGHQVAYLATGNVVTGRL